MSFLSKITTNELQDTQETISLGTNSFNQKLEIGAKTSQPNLKIICEQDPRIFTSWIVKMLFPHMQLCITYVTVSITWPS